jgi:DNA adenine methylase
MCEPFLKWAGGKRWISATLARLLGRIEGRYLEPFLGSGSLFFKLSAPKSILADLNDDLANAFMVVRDEPEELISRLRKLSINRDTFNWMRAANPRSPVQRAARLIYLNRTAFNGLYRVNKWGQFNTPFGCKPGTILCNPDQLRACSAKLRGSTIASKDFRSTLSIAKVGDLVYADPPYTVKHNNNGFRRYNERIFAWRDQLDLAKLITQLTADRVRVISTNAWHSEIAKLYSRRLFFGARLQRGSFMAASARDRGFYDELLLVSRTCIGSPARLAEILKREHGASRVAMLCAKDLGR